MPPEQAEHEHGPEAAADELFPRQAVALLVGDAERRRRARQRVQGWVLGVGLAALALGLPLERFAGSMLVEWTVGPRPGLLPVLAPLVRGLAALTGAPPERAWYFVAAVLYGLSLPALLGLLRAIGFEHRTSLVASLVALASPLAWRGAVSPRADSAALLAAILLARVLFSGRGVARARYAWRAAAAWLVLAALHPELLLLAPVVGWASATHAPDGESSASDVRFALPVLLALLGLLAVLRLASGVGFTALPMLLVGTERPPPFWVEPPALGPILGWLTPALVHGAGVLGILSLFFARRQPEEQPPPRWLAGWTLVLVLPLFLVSFGADPLLVGAGLAPVAAIGVADWIGRKQREEAALLRALPLLGVQLALTAGITMQLVANDPDADWRGPARRVLRPSDLVLAERRAAVHVMRHRWGLEVIDLSQLDDEEGLDALAPILERAGAAGRRVVLALDSDGRDRVRALTTAPVMIDLSGRMVEPRRE